MTAAVAVLGGLVAALGLFVIALLRSHAEILRRLAAIESGLDGAAAPPGAGAGPGGMRSIAMDPRNLRKGHGAAADISGQTLAGDSVKLSFGAGAPATLLAFMGTGCAACVPLWQGLTDERFPTPGGARLVVVTRGAEHERLARLLELAPAGVDLVMSTPAWESYAVPSTPHFVLVSDGRVAGRGAATSWQQITDFLTDAEDDDRIYRARSLNTEARAGRAEVALAEAGIGPGHPSLYPSRPVVAESRDGGGGGSDD